MPSGSWRAAGSAHDVQGLARADAGGGGAVDLHRWEQVEPRHAVQAGDLAERHEHDPSGTICASALRTRMRETFSGSMREAELACAVTRNVRPNMLKSLT